MIYSLFNHFSDVLGARLFTYISFRAILAGVIALLVSVFFGDYFINLLKRKNISETQRDEKTDPFNVAKKGVPTMGGIVVIIAILVAVLLMGNLHNIYLILMLVTMLLLGAIGFADDYIKTFRHNKEGLNGWVKIIGQVALGLIIGLTLRYSPVTTMNEVVETRIENNVEVVYKTPDVKSTRTTIPFVKDHNANYADMFRFLGEENMYRAGWIFFVLLTVFVVAAVSNGANLNDGMDGMCAGNSAIVGVALAIFAYVSSHIVYAAYFDIMYIPQSQELVVFLAAFVGAMVGFLWYNAYPAQVFMGDTGSLAIGGIIGVCAVIIHKELMLPLLCGIFFIESLSVIIQTQWFKIQKRKGKRVRVFRATPIHDTFRRLDSQLDATSTYILKGWPRRPFHESKITIRFWIVTIILAALTIITLKVR